MKKITIPEPCHEDWNKMTPTEKGAYCSKCNLEVIDFTKKSSEEIREILTLNIGKKTCGHIGKAQLELANSTFHEWENQSPKILLSKFLLACVTVFGMALFTGCESTPSDAIDYETVDGGIEILTGDTTYACPSDTNDLVNDTLLNPLTGNMVSE